VADRRNSANTPRVGAVWRLMYSLRRRQVTTTRRLEEAQLRYPIHVGRRVAPHDRRPGGRRPSIARLNKE
jgi:hypothetical protein